MADKFRGTLISCYLGYVTQSIVVNLAPLFFIIFINDYSFTYESLARLVVITFLIQIFVDLASIKFVRRLGLRRVAVISQIFSIVGLFLLGVLPRISSFPAAAVTVSVLIYSIGGGLIEVVVSPIIDYLPSDSKGSSMSLLHSFYSWGQVFVIIVTTLLLKIIGHDKWFYIPMLWSVIPLVNTFNFIKVPINECETSESEKPPFHLFGSRMFVMFIFLMICSGAAEQVIAQWASLFCERGLGVTKVVGDLLGPCLFAGFMGIGRTVYGIFGSKIDIKKALLATSVLSVFCYIAASCSGSTVLSFAGCALCGLGVTLMWPGMISLSSGRFSFAGPSMFSLLAVGGDIGCSLGPYLTGLVSDLASTSGRASALAEKYSLTLEELGLKSGILCGIVFPICMVIGMTVLIIKSKKDA